MNKVFIRSRHIDHNKQLPILLRENDDLTDFNEYSNISKGSQILSGMDKGEESEHHLQEVLRELQYEKTVFNKAIPIPEVTEEPSYEYLYKTDFKLPKHYIRLKTLDFEDELPEYDLDEEDKEWLENSRLNVTSLKFEQIIEQLEKACCQKALLLDEAKSLLRHEAVHLVIAIYDYWLTKRVNTGQTLILSVKAERAERCNNTPIDPYIAFRKRSEKMTTRKSRLVDEASYEKMFRLRYQMEKLSEIIQLVSQREATKSQITQNERDIFIKRYDARDYDKLQLKESEITIKRQSIKIGENFKSAQRSREENQKESKRKRSYSKSFETNQTSCVEQQSEDIDFTFRPMSKCKYLPSRFTMVDSYTNNSSSNSNNNTHNNSHNIYYPHESDNNPKSFSLSKLSYLPEHLHKLNTPVRLRLNSNKMLSIDLQINPTNQRLRPTVTPHSNPDTVDPPVSNRNIFQQSSTFSNRLISKLFNLYNRNIHCGLPPIDYPPETSANNIHISLPPPLPSSVAATAAAAAQSRTTSDATSSSLVNSFSVNKTILSFDNGHHHQNHDNHHLSGPRHRQQRNNSHHQQQQQNNHVDDEHGDHHRIVVPQVDNHFSSSSHDRTCKRMSSLNCHFNSTHNVVTIDEVPLVPSSINSSNSKPPSSSLGNSIDYPLSNHIATNICTYQNNNNNNNPYSHSDKNNSSGRTNGGGGGHNNNNNNNNSNNNNNNNHHHHHSNNTNYRKSCGAFIESDRHLNGGSGGGGGGGQHRKTTATKDLVESQSNHSLNGGFKKQLSKVGLNCFKSLTNKRVIPRKDISELASFYSKSNGHHHNHHNNNIISSNNNNNNNHHHYQNNNHNHHHHNHQHGWLTQQNTPDSCLTQNLLPLWKAEPHVMTSVNKMT